jgi:hypothetical protein
MSLCQALGRKPWHSWNDASIISSRSADVSLQLFTMKDDEDIQVVGWNRMYGEMLTQTMSSTTIMD